MLESSLLALSWGVSAISTIIVGLHWKWRTLDTPFTLTHVIWSTIRDVITYSVIKFAQSFSLLLKL